MVAHVVSSVLQFAVALALLGIGFGLHRAVAWARKRPPEPFGSFAYWNKPEWTRSNVRWLVVGLAVASVMPSIFLLMPDYRALMNTQSAPIGQLARQPVALSTFIMALFYAFVRTGGAEEIVFRGLIGGRLLKLLGFQAGNIIQALFFTLIHNVPLGLVTGRWISLLQGMTFTVVFVMAWYKGWMMKRTGGSIVAPWLVHSWGNLVSWATMAVWFHM